MTEPTDAELNESAMNHFSRGNGMEAARQLQWALLANPRYAEAWHNRAMVLRSLNDPFDAILCCDRALAIDNSCAAYWNTKGVCWASMGQMEKAAHCYDEAIDHDPKLAEAWQNKAYAAKLSNNLDDAVTYYAKAVDLRPENPDLHLAYASALLGSGRLGEGWIEYENRFRTSDAFHRHMLLPRFRGRASHADDRINLVLYAEQGFGDAIQFARYASVLKSKLRPTDRVYIEVKKPLVELFKTMQGFDGVIAYGDPLPAGATHCLPMMSAPVICGTDTIGDIPDVPKFNIPRRALDRSDGLMNVGICWKAGHRPYQPELLEFAARKSVAEQFLMPLGKLPGIRWVNLQVPVENAKPFAMLDPVIYDFYDTAQCIVSDLDYVVTVDTSVAHLAGSLGANTLLMTPFDNCWRWLGDRSDSPWYPTLRQFRQSTPGDWPSVIAQVGSYLSERVKGHAK